MDNVAKVDMGAMLSDPPTSNQTAAESTNTEASSFSLPQEYQEKPWAKSIDSMDALLKQFDNAQSLIGKKTIGVPAEDASPEEWQDFYNRMGRPEEPTAYEFESPSVPDGLELPEDFKRTEEDEKLLKQIFHEAGLTKAQAKELLKRTDKAFLEKHHEQIKQMQEQSAARDNEMVSLFEKHFPGEKENAIAVAETMLKKYVPAGLEDTIRGLDNNAMLALSSVLYKMHKESRSEGKLEKTGESVVPATSPADLRAEAMKIMSDPAYKDPFNKNRDNMMAKVKSLYESASRLESQRR